MSLFLATKQTNNIQKERKEEESLCLYLAKIVETKRALNSLRNQKEIWARGGLSWVWPCQCWAQRHWVGLSSSVLGSVALGWSFLVSASGAVCECECEDVCVCESECER